MLDMRWKGLERAMNLSQVLAQGDAVFLPFFRVVKYPTSSPKTLARVELESKMAGLPDELLVTLQRVSQWANL